jgi:hypothetical protein
MQYGHCVVSATATAINSLYFSGIAPPSLNAASLHLVGQKSADFGRNPAEISGRWPLTSTAPLDRLRLNGLATNGAKVARVYELKMHDEA